MATVSYEEPGAGSIGVMREQVEIDLGPEHLEALQTIVDPVLVSEMPTVVWSPHGHDEAVEALLPLVDVILLDSDDAVRSRRGLRARPASSARRLRGRPGLAADDAVARAAGGQLRSAERLRGAARGSASSRSATRRARRPAGCCWPAGWPRGWAGSGRRSGPTAGERAVAARRRARTARSSCACAPCEQDAPGLGGVTVGCDRGLVAVAPARARAGSTLGTDADGEEREWKILGASRGEGGILGEGVRQALLRDPTYAPALRAARELCPA